MSLIDRYIGKYVPVYCERCGCEIPENEGCVFGDADICEDCWRYAYSREAMADFAMEYAGSWHSFLMTLINEGDLYWSEIVERARDYFDGTFEDFVLKRDKKAEPFCQTAPLKERGIAV